MMSLRYAVEFACCFVTLAPLAGMYLAHFQARRAGLTLAQGKPISKAG